VNYYQISIFKKPWQPIQSEKTWGFSFEIAYKRLEIVFFGEGVATIMSIGCSFKSSFKTCPRPGEICLNLRRTLATLAPASTTKLKKTKLLQATGNVSEH
jgi:hypothetical protein